MTNQATPGWYRDPTGRFGHRWHDGTDWTDTVIGANGQPMLDPYPRADAALRRPAPPAPAASGTRWAPAAAVAPAPTGSTAATPTAPTGALDPRPIGMVAAGLVAVVLSLLSLDWANGVGFLDARDAAGELGGNPADTLLRVSLQFGSFLVVLATGAAAAVALRRAESSIPTIAAGAAALGAALHTFTIVRLIRFPGASPELGAWLGTVGYFVVIAGLALAIARRRT